MSQGEITKLAGRQKSSDLDIRYEVYKEILGVSLKDYLIL